MFKAMKVLCTSNSCKIHDGQRLSWHEIINNTNFTMKFQMFDFYLDLIY